jgi:hypothetical protein
VVVAVDASGPALARQEPPRTFRDIERPYQRREVLLATCSPPTRITIPKPPIMSQQALNKIAPNSPSRAKPSEIETSIATALYELETNIPDMKAALRPLQFVSAREVR